VGGGRGVTEERVELVVVFGSTVSVGVDSLGKGVVNRFIIKMH